MVEIEDRVRRLVLAFERLEASWRREHALTANEKLVVMFLAADGPMTPTDLSDRVGLTTAGISTLLDRLEAEGLVVRRRREDDRRRVLVSLTKKGLRAWMDFEAVHAEVARELEPESVPHVVAFLDRAEAVVLRYAGHDESS